MAAAPFFRQGPVPKVNPGSRCLCLGRYVAKNHRRCRPGPSAVESRCPYAHWCGAATSVSINTIRTGKIQRPAEDRQAGPRAHFDLRPLCDTPRCTPPSNCLHPMYRATSKPTAHFARNPRGDERSRAITLPLSPGRRLIKVEALIGHGKLSKSCKRLEKTRRGWRDQRVPSLALNNCGLKLEACWLPAISPSWQALQGLLD